MIFTTRVRLLGLKVGPVFVDCPPSGGVLSGQARKKFKVSCCQKKKIHQRFSSGNVSHVFSAPMYVQRAGLLIRFWQATSPPSTLCYVQVHFPSLVPRTAFYFERRTCGLFTHLRSHYSRYLGPIKSLINIGTT